MSDRSQGLYRPQWSFVLPIALGVLLGVLGADVVGLVVRALHRSEGTPPAATVAQDGEPATTATAPVDAAPEPAAGDDGPEVEVGKPLGFALPSLPGPSSARRDGDARACINGTVVFRRSNGWEQGLQDDAPVRCRAASP